jgi:hypothetical protein
MRDGCFEGGPAGTRIRALYLITAATDVWTTLPLRFRQQSAIFDIFVPALELARELGYPYAGYTRHDAA